MQRLYNADALCNANVTTALCLSPNPVDPGSTVFYFVPPGGYAGYDCTSLVLHNGTHTKL